MAISPPRASAEIRSWRKDSQCTRIVIIPSEILFRAKNNNARHPKITTKSVRLEYKNVISEIGK